MNCVLRTNKGKSFPVNWAAPSSLEYNETFYASIPNMNEETILSIFKDPDETSTLEVSFYSFEKCINSNTYYGYIEFVFCSKEVDDSYLIELRIPKTGA